MQIHHHGQFGGQQLLIVLRPAPVNVAVLLDGRQWVHRPLRAVGRHHIAVRDQQQRALLARAAQPRHKVQTLGIVAQQFRGNALAVGYLLQILRHARLVPGRIGGVQPDQLRQIARRQIGRRFTRLPKPDCRTCKRGPNKTIHASECSILNPASSGLPT